jgi:phosphoribosyl 1,2-cyclic phosphate phosphodiesterase
LDEVKAFNFLNHMRMPVFASERVQAALKREFAYIFADEKYPGIPEVDLYDVENEVFNIGDLIIEPLTVMHYKLPVKAYRFKDFAYVTDANFISETEKAKLQNLQVLVLNALRRESHISHFTLDEALDLIRELKPKKAYLTHISHQLGTHEEVSRELPDNVELAFDGLQLVV